MISIIVATRNRAKYLADSLGSILKQKLPQGSRCELIVVDNNSTDDTQAVVKGLIAPDGWTVRYLFQPEIGKSRCLNMAIRESSGDPLIFTDDDTIAFPGWLSELIECFVRHSCDAVGGRTLPLYPPGIPGWVRENARILDGPIVFYDHGPEIIRLETPLMSKFIGANMAVRREMFEKYGQYNVDLGPGMRTLGDDTEFINRLIHNKRNLFYCGRAVMWHPVDPRRVNLRYFAQWAHWAGQYYALMERSRFAGKELPSLFGAPRYLWARTFKLGVGMLLSFSRSKFLKDWIQFHLNLGMIDRHRTLSRVSA